MRGCAGALFAAALAAQLPAQDDVVEGTLVEWDSGTHGDLGIRARDNRVSCFLFDPATTVERNGLRAHMAELRNGDIVEVVTERGPNPRLPRARAIRVIRNRPEPPGARAARSVPVSPLEDLFPRGNLTLAGVVTELGPGRMVLRTRTTGKAEIILREDTRYFGDGRLAGYSGLRMNARVFVQAGRNLDDNIEAYQVMWGDILRPGRYDQPAKP
jgi:hypothetical protein